MAARSGVREEAQPGSTLIVIHNFTARSGDELGLAKGDRIELIERDDDFGDGWFLGRHMGNGRTGLFPEVYTTPAPKPTLSNPVQQRGVSETITSTPRTATTAPHAASAPQYRHSSASAAAPAAATRAVGAPQSTPAASAAAVPPTIRTSLPAAVASIPRSEAISTASPVMNETLSVINEHMNDMHTPSSYASSHHKRHSVGPGYAFIAGHETDDENQTHTEEEVLAWTPDRVAEYLEDQGVEKSHCDVFKEQEISGEVLLAMEQSSLFLKEFALGSVGRRLKTWHKIRALQDEVRQTKSPQLQRSILEYSGEDAAGGDAATARNRASTMGSALPRALDTSRQSVVLPVRSSTLQPTSQPASNMSAAGDLSTLVGMVPPVGPEVTWTPSAQTIREMQFQRRQSRRQSSLDRESAAGSVAGSIEMGNREVHRKQPSLDQTWQPGQPQTNGKATARRAPSLSSDAAYPSIPQRDSSLPSSPNNEDLDKGYFSSTEVDSRSRTTTTPATSKTSADIGGSEVSRSSSFGKRRSTHSAGVPSSAIVRDSMSPTVSHGIFAALSSVGNTFATARSATSPTLLNPVVTKLDYSASSEALTGTNNQDSSATNSAISPRPPFLSFHKPKLAGLRTISDTITKNERRTVSPEKERHSTASPARTGSTSPSIDTEGGASSELQQKSPSEAQLRASAGSPPNLNLPQASQRRIRVKPKKATSAYTRGLERKSPAEQMLGSDYSGWMKKKSGSLMTTWKTRLFVLRGRRLSYYYSDNDAEEKGLIDISFHRVLPAHNETLTGLHAAVTGAAGSPTSPRESVTQTAAQQDLAMNPSVGEAGDGMFIFKLVPPKSGLSKGVNFTKPTVHYFAVNSRQEGRLWMAALMKATIDRDEEGMVTTTYNQKTISLAKARARRERPPALMESDGEKERAELDGTEDNDDNDSAKGLGIGGLGANTVSGAENEKAQEDASSLAPSIALTGIDSVPEKPIDDDVARWFASEEGTGA